MRQVSRNNYQYDLKFSIPPETSNDYQYLTWTVCWAPNIASKSRCALSSEIKQNGQILCLEEEIHARRLTMCASESLRSPRVYRLSITQGYETTRQRNEMEINADNVGRTDVGINIYENRRAEARSVLILILMHKTIAPWWRVHLGVFVPRFRRFWTAAEIAYWYEQEETGDVVTTRYQAGLRRLQSESPLYRRYDDVYKTIHDHPWNNEYARSQRARPVFASSTSSTWTQPRDTRCPKPLFYRMILNGISW